MNKKQKTVLVIGIILLLILLSYPPWTAYRISDNKPGGFVSYSFFLDSPASDELTEYWRAKIDVARLIVNNIIIIVCTIGFYWIFKDKK